MRSQQTRQNALNHLHGFGRNHDGQDVQQLIKKIGYRKIAQHCRQENQQRHQRQQKVV